MEYLKSICCKRKQSSQTQLEKQQEDQPLAHEDEEESKIPSQLKIWKFFFRFMKIDWKQFVKLNANLLLCSMIQAYEPFILINIKYCLLEENYSDLRVQLSYYIMCQVGVQILHFLELRNHWNQNNEVKQLIQKSILEHLFSLDLQFFEDNKVSYLSNIVQEGASQISESISYGKITKKLNSYTEILSQILFIYIQSPLIFLLVTVLSAVDAILAHQVDKKKKLSEKNQDFQSEYKNFALDDIISNIQLIKIFRKEKKEIENLDGIIQMNSKYQEEIEYYAQLKCIVANCSFHFMHISVILLIVLTGMDSPDNKNLIANTLAEILTFSYSSFRLAKDISKLFVKKPSKYYNEKYKYIGKVMKLFEVKPLIEELPNHEKPIQLLSGNIKFENVQFMYPKNKDLLLQKRKRFHLLKKESTDQAESDSESSSNMSSHSLEEENDTDNSCKEENNSSTQKLKERGNVLNNISFNIKAGQLVAFVGMSGSGKSTIVKLMERYYDIQSGNILFDNKSIKDISLNDLRGSIGLVNQEPSLFDNDIEYNITYGCPDGVYTKQELRQICDVSGVSEFVFDEKRFPEGLKTLVGSKGMKLSGGQKQRIAIARALIKKPSILILDEATSSLDAESESLVQKYIDQLVGYRGITIIVIAHRLSTIIKSDMIYVMENGEIKEQGNHSELITQDGVYKRLVHHQIQIIS